MMSAKNTMPPVNTNPDWQDRDIKLAPLLLWMAVILAVVIATFIGMAALMSHYEKREAAADTPESPLAVLRQLPEGPMLQVDARGELAVHLAEQSELISGYHWIDEESGIARIPIDRAMAIAAENGIPQFEPLGQE